MLEKQKIDRAFYRVYSAVKRQKLHPQEELSLASLLLAVALFQSAEDNETWERNLAVSIRAIHENYQLCMGGGAGLPN
jgi:hypothetical protein